MTAAPWPHYSRDQLIEDVIALLAEKGIIANPPPERTGERQQAASTLLSAMSVIPTLRHEDALDLDGHASYNRIVHGD